MYSKKQLHNFQRHFFKPANIRPFIRLQKEGNEYVFETIYACGDFLGVTPEQVWEAFVTETKLFGYKITPVTASDKVAMKYKLRLLVTRKLNPGESALAPRPIRVMDTESGETHIFPSISKAAERLHVSPTNIRNRLSTEKKQSLVRGRFLLFDVGTDTSFATPSCVNQLITRQRRQVVMFHRGTHTLTRYDGLSEFTRQNDVVENKTHIYYKLKTYGVYLHSPDELVAFDLKRGEATPDNEMIDYIMEKIKARP